MPAAPVRADRVRHGLATTSQWVGPWSEVHFLMSRLLRLVLRVPDSAVCCCRWSVAMAGGFRLG